MASIYKRDRSPYWWLSFKAPSGKQVLRSTKLRIDDPIETKAARALAAQRTADELSKSPRKTCGNFSEWVESYLHSVWGMSEAGVRKVNSTWRVLKAWADAHCLDHPEQVTYNSVVGFTAWRVNEGPKHGLRPCSTNTAFAALKSIGFIMKEAIRRGFAKSNPVDLVKRHWTPSKIKPEINDQDLTKILDRLKRAPKWMEICFLIAINTGLRMTEARLKLSDVDFEQSVIHIPNPKGGANKAFTTILPESIRPLLLKLKDQEFAFDPPSQSAQSLAWTHFFKNIGLPQYTFHCTRVTFISRGARAGVDERTMRRLVNHSSSAVHRVYQRFTDNQLRDAMHKIATVMPQSQPGTKPSEQDP